MCDALITDQECLCEAIYDLGLTFSSEKNVCGGGKGEILECWSFSVMSQLKIGGGGNIFMSENYLVLIITHLPI